MGKKYKGPIQFKSHSEWPEEFCNPPRIFIKLRLRGSLGKDIKSCHDSQLRDGEHQAMIVIIDLIFLYWASYGGSEKNNIISTIISTSELKLREQTIKCFQRFSVFFFLYIRNNNDLFRRDHFQECY